MPNPVDPDVEADLGALGPADAADARPALEWLLGSHGLDRLHQTGLQQFLWYELPFKWLGPVRGRHQVVGALGRFFAGAGLSRYAELCHSATTAGILDRWAVDPADGFAAFRRTHDRSGVVPPDTAAVQWGDVMGPAELDAFWSTAKALEMAVVGDLLRPTTTGWRRAQADLAERHLRRARPEHFGESLAEAVVAERLAAWLDDELGRGLTARAALVTPVVNELLHDPGVPRRATRSVRGLVWLIERANEHPIALTPSGSLPTAVVRAAVADLGFAAVRSRGREADVGPLAELHGLATRLRLVVRTGRQLRATARGDEAVARPRTIWPLLVGDGAAAGGFAGAVGELLDAVLLEDDLPADELAALLRVPLTEQGWAGGGSGRPVPDATLRPALDRALDRRIALGLLAVRAGRPRDPLHLTAAGQAMAVAVLRARATAPRRA